MFSDSVKNAGRKVFLRILASSASHLGFCLEYCEGTVYSIVYNVVYSTLYCIVYSTEFSTGQSLVLGTVYRRQGGAQVNPRE